MTDRSSLPSFPSSASIGALIRQQRETLGLSQAELAARLSPVLGAQDIAALESGRILVPCWSMVHRLGRALGLSSDAMLVGVLAATNEAPGVPVA